MVSRNNYIGLSLIAVVAGIITMSAISMLSYSVRSPGIADGLHQLDSTFEPQNVQYMEFQPMRINVPVPIR